MGLPNHPELVGEEGVEKTLYLLVYHTDPEYTERTTHVLTFFYAVDKHEARIKADERKRRIAGPVHEIELRACPRGFQVHQTHMEGKVRFNQEGKAL